jgi:hypothetical protein
MATPSERGEGSDYGNLNGSDINFEPARAANRRVTALFQTMATCASRLDKDRRDPN